MSDKKNGASRRLPTAARLLLGLMFFVFGLNGFLHFIPAPPPPEAAMALIGPMIKSGYLIQLIKGTEVTASILLLSNRFVPLALTVLAPVVVNIVTYHAMLAPGGLPMVLVLAAILAYLGYAYRGAFRPMLAARVEPTGAMSNASRDDNGVRHQPASA